MDMSLSGLCTSFSKASVFALCGPCQQCVGGRVSTPDSAGGAHDAPQTPSRLGRGNMMPFPIPNRTVYAQFYTKIFRWKFSTHPQFPSAIRLCVRAVASIPIPGGRSLSPVKNRGNNFFFLMRVFTEIVYNATSSPVSH